MDEKSENKEADICRDERVQECLAPGQDDWVYDYYNQELGEDAELQFEEHLLACDRCQDVLLTLDWVYTEMRKNPRRYPKPKVKTAKRRAATKAKTNNI